MLEKFLQSVVLEERFAMGRSFFSSGHKQGMFFESVAIHCKQILTRRVSSSLEIGLLLGTENGSAPSAQRRLCAGRLADIG